jgi:integrase
LSAGVKPVEAQAVQVGCELDDECFILSWWPDGTRPLNPDSLSSAFTRTAKELDLGHVHLHSLRHFAATEMLAAGVSPKDTAHVLGHANPTMTLQRLPAHSTVDRQRAAFGGHRSRALGS